MAVKPSDDYWPSLHEWAAAMAEADRATQARPVAIAFFSCDALKAFLEVLEYDMDEAAPPDAQEPVVMRKADPVAQSKFRRPSSE